MPAPLSPLVSAVATPPIADVHGWVAGRAFPADRPLLDVCQAVPSYPPAPALVRHVGEAAARPATSLYTEILGLPALRAALAAHLSADYEARVPATHVGITAGCNQAFCAAMTAVTAAGDEVILPLPWYFNHQMWLAMHGVGCVGLPFDPDTGGLPSVAAAAAAITPRTRAIVLVTPNNPTGAEYPPALLESFHALARARGLWLVVDETYKDFRSDAGPPHRLLADPAWSDTLIQLYSFSKAYAITGYRVGSVTASPAVLGAVAKVLDCVAICAPHIGQAAALYALEHLAEWRREKALMMRARVDRLRAAFARPGLGYRLITSGAYFAYVRHPFGETPAAAVARRLATEHGVLCLPGSIFGPGQESCLRFAFANLDGDRIPALVERLVESQAAVVA